MQEQNFEKQVQQKMTELSLTPSTPVWIKLEEQLRKKRDRRRLFFWLPLVAISLSGGVWMLQHKFNNNAPPESVRKDQGMNLKKAVLPVENKIATETGDKDFVGKTKEQSVNASKNLQPQQTYDVEKRRKENYISECKSDCPVYNK